MAFERGAAEARRDIVAGRVRYFSGAPSLGWGRDLADTLLARFGIGVVFTSCFTSSASVSFEEGYNAAVERHVDGTRGDGSLRGALAEVQRRRRERYDAVFRDRPESGG